MRRPREGWLVGLLAALALAGCDRGPSCAVVRERSAATTATVASRGVSDSGVAELDSERYLPPQERLRRRQERIVKTLSKY